MIIDFIGAHPYVSFAIAWLIMSALGWLIGDVDPFGGPPDSGPDGCP